jgi:putative hydrolase of the HAD superfamily
MQTILCDLDDTIISTNALYRDALHNAAKLLQNISIASYDVALQRIGDVDIRNASSVFHRSRFPTSMVEAYHELATEKGWRIFPYIDELLYNIGDAVFTKNPVVHSDAYDVLETLGNDHRMVLVTKGDSTVQEMRIQQAEIRPYFDDVFIVPNKTTTTYAQILDILHVRGDECWMIGDSIKSDINPMVSLGAQAICVRYHDDVWSFEHEEAIGPYHSAASLTEAMRIIEGV